MEGFGDFGDENTMNYSESQFESQQPFGDGGMQMNAQSNFPMPAQKIDNDLTPEEQELIEKVQLEDQDRKKALYDK